MTQPLCPDIRQRITREIDQLPAGDRRCDRLQARLDATPKAPATLRYRGTCTRSGAIIALHAPDKAQPGAMWAVQCESHGYFIQVRSHMQARQHTHNPAFCPECREVMDTAQLALELDGDGAPRISQQPALF